MLDGKGRKVIKEKEGNEVRTFNHSKGMEDFDKFDQEWNRMADQLGFQSNSGQLKLELGTDKKADSRGLA